MASRRSFGDSVPGALPMVPRRSHLHRDPCQDLLHNYDAFAFGHDAHQSGRANWKLEP